MDDATLRTRVMELQRHVNLLSRKIDFVLQSMNLEFVDPGPGVPPELMGVYALVRQGKKLEAIKLYQQQTGLSLAQSKAAVEAMEEI